MYLLDYEVLDGVTANEINGKQTYLCAPLCLLHLNQQGQLLPIAIQVRVYSAVTHLKPFYFDHFVNLSIWRVIDLDVI